MAPNVTAGAMHAKYRKNEHATVLLCGKRDGITGAALGDGVIDDSKEERANDVNITDYDFTLPCECNEVSPVKIGHLSLPMCEKSTLDIEDDATAPTLSGAIMMAVIILKVVFSGV